jgi:cytochrome c oxidase cbb3-type subunit 3/ubiquinol-cytochrome c reductase cytochrome c subunit
MRIVLTLCLLCAGCAAPPSSEVPRPELVLDVPTLYKQNCAGCHGDQGKNGAAISLANPVYLAFAGPAAVREVTANGVAGKLMPAFAQSAGGSLTDAQIDSLVDGMFKAWSRTESGPSLPYAPASKGDAERGQAAFAQYCARCHGAGGIADSTYLALVSDQSLRSAIIAGATGMPDWRSAGLADQQITDIVAWLATKRVAP